MFVQDGIFNEVPNTLVITKHSPAARTIKVRVILFSSLPFELDGIATDVGLKTGLFHRSFQSSDISELCAAMGTKLCTDFA